MSLLVTAEAIADRSGGRVTDAEAEPFAAAASAMIRALCGWHVAPVIEEDLVVGPPFGCSIQLPTLRLEEVISAKANGVDVPVLAFNRYGVISTGPFATRGDLRVKVRHGFEAVPLELVDLAALAALRVLTAPTGVTREQVGAHSVSFSLTGAQSAGSLVVLDSERAILAPYVLPAVP